ncbi:MAG: hypothetical protein GY796_14055 [Chloroflexi bacterium]|nr:hypothetical protein [Chloroflexota bacterium]
MKAMNQINELFSKMDKWRHLPTYQLEKRADIFFSIYLGDILSNRFNVEIDHVLPEFPVRIGTINPQVNTNNRSFKIDYLAKVKNSNTVIFVELKTDDRSRRRKQDWYLQRVEEVGIVKLLHGLRKIVTATRYKKKYWCLLEKLQEMGLIGLNPDKTIEIIDVEYEIQVVYIQPNNINGEENVISFYEIAETIEQPRDELGLRFAQSLREWASVKVGEYARL